MAKKPASPAPNPRNGGRPNLGERTQIAARYPQAVLDGIDRQAKKDGLSRNDALIKAALNYGDFPNGRPVVGKEKASVASRVTTSERDPVAPGSRLDKKSIGKRTGPPISKKPAAKAPTVADEAF